MKKLFMAGLLILSMNFLSASAEEYMNRYISRMQREYLIAGEFITEYNQGLKAMYMAKVEANYDTCWSTYLKSFFIETPEGNTIRGIKQVEQQLRNRLAILQNNTWEQWGWACAKYSAVIALTAFIVSAAKNPVDSAAIIKG